MQANRWPLVLFADSVAFRLVPLVLVMASLQDIQVVLLIRFSLPTALVPHIALLDRELLVLMPAFRRGGRPGA